MPDIKLPRRKKDPKTGKDYHYVYFLRVGKPTDRLFKIGTTCQPIVRIGQLEKKYDAKITVLWVSPPLRSKYTTLRVEDEMKAQWKKLEDWIYEPQDRFIIPKNVKSITIKIVKEYSFQIA